MLVRNGQHRTQQRHSAATYYGGDTTMKKLPKRRTRKDDNATIGACDRCDPAHEFDAVLYDNENGQWLCMPCYMEEGTRKSREKRQQAHRERAGHDGA